MTTTQSQPPIAGTTHTLLFDDLSATWCLWLVECEGWERAEHHRLANASR